MYSFSKVKLCVLLHIEKKKRKTNVYLLFTRCITFNNIIFTIAEMIIIFV